MTSTSDTPFSTPDADTVTRLTGLLPDAPISTIYALATLVDWRGADVSPLGRDLDLTGVSTVWLVSADSFAAGFGDLDNRPWTVGVFADLHVAVAAVWREIVQRSELHNPTFDQQIVRTVLAPAARVTADITDATETHDMISDGGPF